jgi:integrase
VRSSRIDRLRKWTDLAEARYQVRKVRHRDGSTSYWIFSQDGELHRDSLNLLKRYGSSTQQTYAYSLLDHLNWLDVHRKAPSDVTFDDLRRYMSGVSGTEGVYGFAYWRPDRSPLGRSAACNVATVLRSYYLSLPSAAGVSTELVETLASGSVGDPEGSRRRRLSNPLAPKKSARRPRFLPDEVVEALFEPGVLTTARDTMIVTWLHDGGVRVGGLCGLRFCDVHLITHHPCGQRADPHIHIVGRHDNPNGARAKAYRPANVSKDGYVLDGVIRAVSSDMVSTFHAYLLDDYHAVQHLADHEQVLVHVQGPTAGMALTTAGVRKMLRRACRRAALNAHVTPHAFRHKAASAFYEATDFNAEMVAQEFGWAGPEIVTGLYGRSANRKSMKFLQQAWEATARPPSEPYLGSSTADADSQ